MSNSMLKEIASEHYASQNKEPGVLVLLLTGMVSSTVAMTW